jgi:hypothetical protein
MTTKNLKRKRRVLRLLAIVQAYHHYTMMQMNRKLLRHDTNWEKAEQLSLLIGMLIPHSKCSPTDFLHNKDELCDAIIDDYDGFKNWIKIAETYGVSKKALVAFCKNVDNLQSAFRLKIFGHIFYPDWLMALYSYLDNTISKTELQNIFVEYSLFSGKEKPANLTEFRKTILEIEKNILEITNKQISRGFKKRFFKIKTSS